jgi:hypothetical protein
MNGRGLTIDTRIKLVLKKWDLRVWTGFDWLRIVSTGGLL